MQGHIKTYFAENSKRIDEFRDLKNQFTLSSQNSITGMEEIGRFRTQMQTSNTHLLAQLSEV